jgi:hypothetical protein
VRAVYVDDLLRRWIIELVRSTREVEMCTLGASVRGTLALERAARAWALLDEREYVVSDDVEQLFLPVIAHRVVFRPAFRAQARRTGWEEALDEFRDACLRLVPAPNLETASPPRGRPARRDVPPCSSRPDRRAAFGAMRSARKGQDPTSRERACTSRGPFPLHQLSASARLSAARDSETFVLREHYADEAPRVVVVADRRPEMQLFPPGFPWLRKGERSVP